MGIESDQRQELNNQEDYDLLFKRYKKNNLTKTINTQSDILKILATNDCVPENQMLAVEKMGYLEFAAGLVGGPVPHGHEIF